MPFQYQRRSNDYSSIGKIFSGAAADLFAISQEYSWDPSEIVTNEMKRRARLGIAKNKAESELANYALELDARSKSREMIDSGKRVLSEANRKAGGLAALGAITTKSANDYLRLKNKEKPESFDLDFIDKKIGNIENRIEKTKTRGTEINTKLENLPPATTTTPTTTYKLNKFFNTTTPTTSTTTPTTTTTTTSSLPLPIPEGSNVTYKDGKYTVPLVDFGKHLRDNIGLTVVEHPEFGGVTPGIHTPSSYHYAGNALDIQDWRDDDIDGVFWKTRTSNLGNLLKDSGVEVLHPGNAAGHDTHVHLAAHPGGKIILNREQFKQLYTEGTNRSVFNLL